MLSTYECIFLTIVYGDVFQVFFNAAKFELPDNNNDNNNNSNNMIIIFFFCASGGRSYWRESGLRYCDGMRLEKFCVKLFTVSGRRRPTTYNIVNGTRWSCDPHREFPTVSVEKKPNEKKK